MEFEPEENGTTYVTESTYDEYHRPSVVTYPGVAHRLSVKTFYNEFGFPAQIRNAGTNQLYQATLSVDAFGNTNRELLGNGVETTRIYDPRTNRLQSISSQNVLGVLSDSLSDAQEADARLIQELDYEFDVLGNLRAREDVKLGVAETYKYDVLNRLTEAHTTLREDDNGNGFLDPGDSTVKNVSTYVTYDHLGNIVTKSGIGKYTYGSPSNSCASNHAGPHAVTSINQNLNNGISGDTNGDRNRSYCYDANGNMVTREGQQISYTHFDKPSYIAKLDGGVTHNTSIKYGPDRSRYQRIDNDGATTTTYTYAGAYEKVEKSNATTEERHYVGPMIITYKGRTSTNVGVKDMHFLHTDHIGSTNVITDKNGAAEKRFSFDAWGKRRAIDLKDLETRVDEFFDQMTDIQKIGISVSAFEFRSSITNKGFTGHEQMDGVGLIHMNGRVYDAELGRFISADPFIQDRTDTQNLNRYSYVNNNPLSYTDPSGYFFKKAFKKLTKWVKKVWKATIGKIWAESWRHAKRVLKAIGKVDGLAQFITIAINFIPGCTGWCSSLVSAAFNAALQAAHGVPFGDIATGFAVGAATGALANKISAGIGDMAGVVSKIEEGVRASAGTIAVNAVGSGIAGGIAAKAQGGKFADGLRGGAAGAVSSLVVRNMFIGEAATGTDAPGEKGAAQESGPQGCYPVNYATGEKYLTLSDITATGNSRLKFERHYASFTTDATEMGNAWRHTYSRKLELIGAKDQPHRVILHRENGESMGFNYIVGEGFVASHDKGYRLSAVSETDQLQVWSLVTPDNVTEYYDASGLLVEVEFIGGYKQYLSYEDENWLRAGNTRRLLAVSDSFGYELAFDYDAFGLLASVANNAGKTIRYAYDTNDNLIAAYDELGRATLSALGHRAEADRVVFHARSDQDLAAGVHRSTVTNALGRQTTYTFDKNNNPLTVAGDATASCIASNQGYGYDSQGRVVRETDWNDVETLYEYNDRGLEVVRIQAAGTDVERRIENTLAYNAAFAGRNHRAW